MITTPCSDASNLQPLLSTTIQADTDGCVIASLSGQVRITDNFVVFQVRVNGVPLQGQAPLPGFITPVVFVAIDATSNVNEDEQCSSPPRRWPLISSGDSQGLSPGRSAGRGCQRHRPGEPANRDRSRADPCAPVAGASRTYVRGPMKRLMPFFAASAGVLLLALTLILTNAGQVVGQSTKPQPVEVVNSRAKPVPVAATPAPADYVTLEDVPGQEGGCEFGTSTERILPDGTREPFAVPRGRVLVLTDMQGEVSAKYPIVWNASHVGYIATLGGIIQGVGPSQYFEARTQVNGAGAIAQILPLEFHLQTGAVAGPGSIVCLRASLGLANSSFAANARARFQGFLMDQ